MKLPTKCGETRARKGGRGLPAHKFRQFLDSAEGAAFHSHGRKAVGQNTSLRLMPEGPTLS